MIQLSVVIITYNEEKNLERCIISLKDIADEIIIVDSNSTDRTVAIAEEHGAKVFQKPFMGYGEQKNYANSLATNDWVLSLDADEALTPELRASITKMKNNPQFDVYEMARLTKYCGQWIKHSGWYPDHQTRLYNRTRGRWIEKRVHEYWEHTDKEYKKGLLDGDMLHYSFSSISEHLKKIDKYSDLGAQEAVANNKDVTLMKLFFSPLWHFLHEYFFRLGFLDGFYGYMICKLSAYAAFCKCSKIRYYYRQKHNIKQA